jgi:Family of unknown function (DUF6406)
VPDAGTRIQVAAGRVTGYHGIRFGGFACVAATGTRSAWIRIVVRHPGGEFDANLREGNTFRVGGQAWRLDAIHGSGHSWHADLTRVT